MRVFNIESVNINGGSELAEKAYILTKNINFEMESDLDLNQLLIIACKLCHWQSVPQSGGLVVEWCD